MSFPRPANGQVIRYSYLWRREYLQGQDEGVKERPCAVILVTMDGDGDEVVTALPITHSPPADASLAIEIPSATKHRLGLDSERSWIVLTEANRFVWPGPDLVPARAGDSSTIVYGLLPRGFYEQVRQAFLAFLKTGRARTVSRSD